LKGQGAAANRQQQGMDIPYPYLNHLLPTSITVPTIEAATPEYIDSLLSFVPPSIIVLASGSALNGEPSSEDIATAREALSLEDKRSLLKKVLRSPQFQQALAGLTMALRDGGMPSIAEALGIRVENGGRLPGSSMPLGGGEAVRAFVEGVKKTVQGEKR
jgi:hypothetical protein